MTGPATLPAAVAPGQLQRGQSLARDAALFLGLGSLAGIGSALAYLTAYSAEALTSCGVGSAAWMSLTAVGMYKLVRAQRAGASSGWSRAAQIVAVLNLSTVLIFACIRVFPGMLSDYYKQYTAPVIGAIPLIDFSLALLWLSRRRATTGSGAVRRAACFIAISALCLAYLFAVLEPCPAGALVNSPFDYGWYPSVHTAPILSALAGIPSIVFFCLALRELFLARVSGCSQKAGGWALFAAWVNLCALTCMATWLLIDDRAVIGGIIGAAVSALVAGAAGVLISRPWRPQRTWVLRWAVTIPLLLLLWLFVPMTTAMYFPAHFIYEWHLEDNIPAHPWTWYMPEVVRAPAARWLAARSEMFERYSSAIGLGSVEDQKKAALTGRDWLSYLAWVQRDPTALSMALAVPPVSGNLNIPNTTYDSGAGILIADCGGEAEILKRLSGNYSNALINGMLWRLGLRTPVANAAKFREPIASLFQTRAPDRMGWRTLNTYDPVFMRQCFVRMLKNPAPDYTSISAGLNVYGFDGAYLALNSSDPTVRTLALMRYYPDIRHLARILECADGKTPGSTFNEQRASAHALEGILRGDWSRTQFNVTATGASGAPAPAPSAPLTRQESAEIDKLIRLGRERLKKQESR